MKRTKKIGLLTGLTGLVLAGMISTGLAQTVDEYGKQMAVSAKIGTLGIGAELTYGFSERYNARVGVNYISFDADYKEKKKDEGDLNIEFDMLTLPLLLDWHPKGGGFRLSGGAALGFGSWDLEVENYNKSVKIGKNKYMLSSFEGKGDIPLVSPYLGVGYGNPFGNGRWRFSFDLGVMANIDNDATIKAVAKDPRQQAALDADLKREKNDIEDRINLYPVVMIGVSYSF